ncbi:hypothetical protein KQ939_12420 [Planococcus sp. CP5-4]|uniref:hypothetical protein n=1 Tax=unclassified Planococcus (in: firmicutes) TaxID=2662419 RepID=UPI001C23B839|nr:MULTISPECIES: hypothetical protein [unclassified Planococcus (in: firmicutes)]MBU9673923.1 hypothetical protein [Planococcus sp. CP5-4_YE]MBV0909793.1 hypothetical protein [Planococcus sp. CP5-4_UN]MBW6064508.1 hypothetical protein [Planococcus sp. CP5-4]
MVLVLIGMTLGIIITSLILSLVQTFFPNKVNEALDKEVLMKVSSIRFYLPILLVGAALLIIALNFSSLNSLQFDQDKGILFSFLEVELATILGKYILLILCLVIIWVLGTTLISFSGLKSFSGFGFTAELKDTLEKVEKIRKEDGLNSSMERLRENMINIIIEDAYVFNYIIPNIKDGGIIEVDNLYNDFLKNLSYVFEESESNIKLLYHIEAVFLDEVESSKERISRDLSEEMKQVSLAAIQTTKSSIWKNSVAIVHTPFGINNESYYVISITADSVKFTQTDIDFLQTCLKIIETFVDLKWYEKYPGTD